MIAASQAGAGDPDHAAEHDQAKGKPRSRPRKTPEDGPGRKLD